jgi:hypothetical protein
MATCARAQCGKPGLERCTACKVVYYCSRACQAVAWREGHKLECRALAEQGLEAFDLFALAPGDSATRHAPLPASDTTKMYLTGASAGLGRLTARFYAGSVRKSLQHSRRSVASGALGEETLRGTLRELRAHQRMLDSPPTPSAYQEAIGGMVNALERWHCLRLALRDVPIPWMTLEEGEAYEVSNRAAAMAQAEAAARAEEAGGAGAGAAAGGGGGEGGAARDPDAMPALTWMG